MPKLKVLIICHEFPPAGGGASNASFYLAKHLTRNGYQVTVMTSRFGKTQISVDGCNVLRLCVLRRRLERTSPLELISFAVSGLVYALFYIRKRSFDACIAVHGIPSGWVALFIKKFYKIPYLVSLRGGDVPGFLPQSYEKLHKSVAALTDSYWKNASAIIANSRGLKGLADATAGRLKRKVQLIPNGIDCNLFSPDFSLRDNRAVKIIYAGRITPQKDLGCLIEAVKAVYGQTKSNFSLELIGEGPSKNDLQHISRSLREAGVVEFTGWLSKHELLNKYRSAHVFVLPSLYEGMSNSLLEAMACGCMALVSNITANSGLVKEGKNGFMFTAHDAAGLKNALIKTINSDIEAIEMMGKQSRRIAGEYDWENTARLYADYCLSAAAGRMV